MEFVFMHAFLLINKYHIKVMGRENIFIILKQFMVLAWSFNMLLLDGKEKLMIQDFYRKLSITSNIIFQ